MHHSSSLLIASVICFASAVSAAPITYAVNVNTSSITGTAGSLDFNFNPGLSATQAASLQILSFASNGSLVNCAANVQGFCPTGDVSGQLPATLTFDNGTGFNDYFDDFTFGTTISFDFSLYGPALSSPDAVSTSGSTFAFSMFSDAAGTIPALTTDTADGWALLVNVNLDGTTTPTDVSAQTMATPLGSLTPEPATLTETALGIGVWATLRFCRRRLRHGGPF
jgi:hypothetical protein